MIPTSVLMRSFVDSRNSGEELNQYFLQAIGEAVRTVKQAYTDTVEAFKQGYSATVEAIETSKQAIDVSLDRMYGYHGPVTIPTGVTGQIWMPVPSWYTGDAAGYMLLRAHVDQFPVVGKASEPWPSTNECVTAAMLEALNMLQDIMTERVGIAPLPSRDLPWLDSMWGSYPANRLWRTPADTPLIGGMLIPYGASRALQNYANQMQTNWGCSFQVELTSGNTVGNLIENIQNGYPTMLHFSQDVPLFGADGFEPAALLGGIPHTVDVVGYDPGTDNWQLLDPAVRDQIHEMHTDELMELWGRHFLLYTPRFAMTTLIPENVCTTAVP